jgi:hypothetical protein
MALSATETELVVEMIRQLDSKLDRQNQLAIELAKDVAELKTTARWWGATSGLFSGIGSTVLSLLIPAFFRRG